jgi:drug/metabolite transporter (DMT)-like permease
VGKGANKNLAAVLALLAGCCFGIGGSISQVIVGQGFQVMHVVIGQIVVSFIILGIISAIKYRGSVPKIDILKLLTAGILFLASTILYYFSIDLLSVGTTVAIMFQYVWIVVVFECIATRKLPGKWTVLSALIIIVGSLMGSGLLDELIAGNVSMNPLGLVLALCCAVSYAGFIFLNSRIAVDSPAIPRSFWQQAGALIVLAIIFPILNVGPCDVVAFIPWAFLMGILMGVIPIVFIVVASSNLKSGMVSILTSSELPMAVLSGFLILGETVTPLVVVGVVLICGSIALAQLDNRGEPNSLAPQ